MFKKINKEREFIKKKAIEDKILVKDASVKRIQAQKLEDIEVKKVIDQKKREEKKAYLIDEKLNREQ